MARSLLLALPLVALACVVDRAPIAPKAGPSSTITTPDPSPRFAAALDAYVAAFGKTWGGAFAFHGYVAVARDGRIVFGKGYGAADREAQTPFDGNTAFRIGSITKSFTAVALLQLEQRGLLHIDDPVRKYLPELPTSADAITLRHLLTHSGGLPPLADDPGIVAETGARHDLAAAMAQYASAAPTFTPGTKFEYSNAGYTLLGAILERVSGESYDSYLREHVFAPAGMTRTTTVSTPAPAGLATGWNLDARGALSLAPSPLPYITFGCGAIVLTANDLVAFDRALSRASLLDEASARRMVTPARDLGELLEIPSQYALGWFVSHVAGHEVVWHGGGVEGFESRFGRAPDAGVSIVVLSNRFGDLPLVPKVFKAALSFALTSDGPAPEDEPEARSLDAKETASLEGDYGADKATRAALVAKFPSSVVDRKAGLSITSEAGHALLAWIDDPGREIFRGPDGTLFMKIQDLRVALEGDASRPTSVALLPREERRTPLRYVRLDATFDPTQDAPCPARMVRVPGGARVASFCTDATEVTVAAYAACVRAGKCRPAPTDVQFDGVNDALRAKWSPMCNGNRTDRADHPVNCVEWTQADAYCRAQGKRLPTDDEWGWASRGGDQARVYPWGYRPPKSQLCWSGIAPRAGTCPVASFPDGDGRGAIHDLAGNVGEWTATPKDSGHVARGGGFNMVETKSVRADASDVGEPHLRAPTVGFRCAK